MTAGVGCITEGKYCGRDSLKASAGAYSDGWPTNGTCEGSVCTAANWLGGCAVTFWLFLLRLKDKVAGSSS
jgi:hypothetical protein